MPNIARPAPIFSAPILWLAVTLCVVLTVGRGVSGWAALSALHLPDTDDVMRLVQIRDWLGGQGFFDLTQYRLGGADGTPMHWSRIGDLGPAAIILATQPLLGAHGAELAALILWPSLLFLGFMLLVAAIAGKLGGEGSVGVAIVLAALAWPAAALFVPGRIDHHGLQLVLLLVALLHSVGRGSRRHGIVTGVAIATSLAVGVELVVPIAILCAHIVACWIQSGERARLSGVSLGLLGGLGAMALLAPNNWVYPACDAFTQQAALAALCGGLAMAVLGHLPVTLDRLTRLVAALGVGVAAIVAILGVAPACMADPYAAVDPLVRSGWMARVEEARGLMALSLSEWVGMAGLPMVALIAAIVQTARGPAADWMLVTLVILGSVALAMVQARAIHVAAAVAPAVLAPVVAYLRSTRPKLAPLAWLLSIGISYPLVAKVVASPVVPASQRCDPGAALTTLAQRQPGVVLAPIDLGPRLLVETHHRVLAAPYHRNGYGIRAWMDGGRNPALARIAGAEMLILCPTDTVGPATLVPLAGQG